MLDNHLTDEEESCENINVIIEKGAENTMDCVRFRMNARVIKNMHLSIRAIAV